MIKYSKILCIDYGSKRCGVSITDNQKVLALGLACIKTKNLINFLNIIIKKENIYLIVLGYPIKLNNKYQNITNKVLNFKKKLLKLYPKIIIDYIDERYTSKLARYYLYKIKTKKKYIKTQEHIMSAIL
ncbi:MAG: Holliday junction resolvase RuvX, partial [Candidatus Shikimatogenerans sp. JK-2022]|nr:Holliday junction resolvase RuvX [Candidatus Shikimatogenerans bostrichidophilus]